MINFALKDDDNGTLLLGGDLTPNGSGAYPVIPIAGNFLDLTFLAQVNADPDCFVFNELFPSGFNSGLYYGKVGVNF